MLIRVSIVCDVPTVAMKANAVSTAITMNSERLPVEPPTLGQLGVLSTPA